MKFLASVFLVLLSFNVFASDITVVWDTPTTRVDGTPMSIDEIGGYEIYQVDSENSPESRILIGTVDGLSTEATLVADIVVGQSSHFVMRTFDTDFLYSDWSAIANYRKVRPGKVIIRSVKVRFN